MFKGSEKQIKWANDIVDNTRKAFENKVREAESDSYTNPKVLKNYKNLYEIAENILSNLSLAWSAGDVIENRNGLESGDLEILGIKVFGGCARIKVDGRSYKDSDLKNSETKKEIENRAIDYLKNKKS